MVADAISTAHCAWNVNATCAMLCVDTVYFVLCSCGVCVFFLFCVRDFLGFYYLIFLCGALE